MSPLTLWQQATFSYIGALIALAAYQEASGNAELSLLHRMFFKKGPQKVTSTLSQRIGSLIGYLITVSTSVVVSAYIVGAMEKDIFAEGFTTVKKDHDKFTLVIFLGWMLCMMAILYGKWKVLQPTPVARRCIAVLDGVLGGSR